MSLSDTADWLWELETALDRIYQGGGFDLFWGDADSSEIEMELIARGGVNGMLFDMERTAKLDPKRSLNVVLVSSLYDIPTVILPDSETQDACDYILSLIPSCRKCGIKVPSALDDSGFSTCEACSCKMEHPHQ